MQRLIRESDQMNVATRLRVADRFFSRLKGLIGVKRFESGDALLFPRCNSIHMWMMSIPIDVVFLKTQRNGSGEKWMITSVHPELQPWKLLPVSNLGADDTLELPSGMAGQIGLKPGEVLCIAS